MRQWQKALALCAALFAAAPCYAAEADVSKRRTFVLEIDVMMADDELHQEIVIEEQSTFYVSTLVGEIRWTFAGDVGRVVEERLPVMMKSRWYADARSNTTSITPKLLKINDKTKAFSGALHGHSLSVIAREPTDEDQLPSSPKMERALRRMIGDLQGDTEKDSGN